MKNSFDKKNEELLKLKYNKIIIYKILKSVSYWEKYINLKK